MAQATQTIIIAADHAHPNVIRDLVRSIRAGAVDEKHEDAMRRDFEKIMTRVWDTPIRTWADIVARAEIARFWANQNPADADDLGDRAFLELLNAVLSMRDRKDAD